MKLTQEMIDKIITKTGCYAAIIIIITPEGKAEAIESYNAPADLIPKLAKIFLPILNYILPDRKSNSSVRPDLIRGIKRNEHN